MGRVDKAELERRVRLNETALEAKGANADLGYGETILFILTIAVISLGALLWSWS